MNELKKDSLLIDGKVVDYWPDSFEGEKEQIIDLSKETSLLDNVFCINNSTMGYIVDHQYYVTPYTREAMDAVRRAGLGRQIFYVPFSHGDYPKPQKRRWDELRKKAAMSH